MTMNEQVWRLMVAKCNAAEIAAYFDTTECVAKVWMLNARREARGKR